MAFYDGIPGDGGRLIGTARTAQALAPGQYVDLNLQWTDPAAGVRSIYTRADDDGTGISLLNDVNPDNNQAVSQLAICTAPQALEGISGQVIDAMTGEFLSDVTVYLHVDDEDRSGELIGQYLSDDQGGFIFSGLDASAYILTTTFQGYLASKRRVILAPGLSLAHQDLVLSPVLGLDEFRIVLTWGEYPSDLEAHLTAPNPGGCRSHCFYWNKYIPGANLDLDDKASFGPETISITEMRPGIYRFYVHDFTNRLSPSSSALSRSDARVTVYSGSSDDPITFSVPEGPGTVWHVFNLNGDDGTILPIEKMTHQTHPGRIDFPVITSSPPTTATYGETYFYQVASIDPDLDPLIYSIVQGPPGMIIDPLSGLIQWPPTGAQGGWHNIKVRVNDGSCGEDTQAFRVYVTYIPVVQFSIDPCSGMNPSGQINLTWQTERAETVVINQGIGEVAANGSLALDSPDEPIAYTLTAANGAGQVQRTVPGVPTASLSVQPGCITSGNNSALTWTSHCATACSIGPNIGEVPPSGSQIITPADSVIYTMSCTNGAGSSNNWQSVFLSTNCDESKPAAVIIADPDCDWSPGDAVTLSWSASMVESCEIDQGIGIVPLNGSMLVMPTEPTTYRLTAHGPEGYLSDDVSKSITLTWTSLNADSISIDQDIGIVDYSASLMVFPSATTTYTISATGSGGTSTSSVTVTVIPPISLQITSPLNGLGRSASRPTQPPLEPIVPN